VKKGRHWGKDWVEKSFKVTDWGEKGGGRVALRPVRRQGEGQGNWALSVGGDGGLARGKSG